MSLCFCFERDGIWQFFNIIKDFIFGTFDWKKEAYSFKLMTKGFIGPMLFKVVNGCKLAGERLLTGHRTLVMVWVCQMCALIPPFLDRFLYTILKNFAPTRSTSCT